MSKLMIKEKTNIHNMIYEINGKQVILDRDLAKLYEIETKVLIQNKELQCYQEYYVQK